MALWKERGRWRYEFQYLGQRRTGAGFKTRAAAMAAREQHKARLKTGGQETLTPTATGFLTASNEYLDHGQRRLAAKTFKYKRYVFQSFLAYAGDLPLPDITPALIESYLRTRHSNVNYNRHRKDLCALFAWAWRREYMPQNPCIYIDKLPEPRYSRQIPTPEEMAAILLAAGSGRPFMLTLYHTMARVDEILRLRWEDVNFEGRAVTLWTRKRQDGSWASDLIPMNQVLYDTLWGLYQSKAHAEWVFVNPRTGTRFMHRPKLMRGVCRRAGVRHFGFHAIRHYVASYLADTKKFSVARLSKLLRHQSKQTTERYLQLIDPSLREVMEALAEGGSAKAHAKAHAENKNGLGPKP